jgi:transmembrane sensor
LSVTQNEKPGREALAQASVWLARLRADDCTPEDQRNFAAWLAEASTHRSAFETVTAAFDMAGAAATDHWPRTPPMEDEGELEPVSAVPASRRSFLLGAGIVAVGGGAIGWQAAFAGAIETGFGERRSVQLSDGTTVLMDAETRVREPWLRERRLNLQRGRISVQVPENAQAFRIDADAHVIRGNAMDADVRWENGGLTVSVVRGTLSVSNKGGAPVRLSEGQRLLPSGMIDLPTMGALTAWRDGQLVFVDTPLADACAELNRYDRTRLIPAPDAAGLRISGTYRMGSNVQFARALEQLLPLHRQVVDGVVRLERIDVRQ